MNKPRLILFVLTLALLCCALAAACAESSVPACDTANWPPAGKEPGICMTQQDIEDKTFFCGSGSCSYILNIAADEDMLFSEDRDYLTRASLVFVSGDEALRDAVTLRMEGDGINLCYDARKLTGACSGLFHIYAESDRFYCDFDYPVKVLSPDDVTVSLSVTDFNVDLNDERNINGVVDPSMLSINQDIRYFLFLETADGMTDFEDDRFWFTYSEFIAKQEGDYDLQLVVALGENSVERRFPITLHAAFRQYNLPEDCIITGDWPPADKKQGFTNFGQILDLGYGILNGQTCSYSGYLYGQQEDEYNDAKQEKVIKAYIEQTGGDPGAGRCLRLVDQGRAGEPDISLVTGDPQLTEPGTATWLIRLESDHYWYEGTAEISFIRPEDVRAQADITEIKVPVGTEVNLKDYLYRVQITVDPESGYKRYYNFMNSHADSDNQTGYTLSGNHFTAAEPGDYEVAIGLYYGVNEARIQIPITVHAAEVDPSEQAAASDWQYERQLAERGTIADTGNGLIAYEVTEDKDTKETCAAITGMVGREDLTVPAEIDGLPVRSVDFKARNVLVANKELVRTITFEEGIRRLEKGVFQDLPSLEKIVLPASIQEIGMYAFKNCVSLKEVVFAEGSSLTGKNFGYRPFWNTCMEDLVLPSGVSLLKVRDGEVLSTNAGIWTYQRQEDGTAKIVEVKIDRKYVDGEPVADEELIIPAELNGLAVTVIGKGAFSHEGTIRKAVLPEGLLVIEAEAFANCENLEEIVLPESLTYIGDNAFKGVAAPDLELPESARAASSDLWYSQAERTDGTGKWIYAPVGGGNAAIVDAVGFKGGTLTFPETVDGLPVTVIALKNSPDYRDKTQKAVIPEGVMTIGDNCFTSFEKLTSVTLPSTLKKIGDSAFYHTGLQKVTFPEGLETIGEYAFYGTSLTEADLPASLKRVGTAAFVNEYYNGKIITKVTIRSADAELDDCIFRRNRTRSGDDYADPTVTEGASDIDELKLFCYPGSTADLKYKYFVKKEYLAGGEDTRFTAEVSGSALTAADIPSDRIIYEIIIPEGVERIDDRAFAGRTTLMAVTLPSTLKSIGEEAFSGCSALKDIKLPAGLESLGKGAFADCAMLSGVTLPEGIAEIPDELFRGCASLASCKLPKSGIRSVGASAFCDCAALTSFAFPKGLESVGEKSFMHSGIKAAVLPDSVTALGADAFRDTNISKLTLPKGLTEIPDRLCAYCFDLKAIQLPKGVTRIGDSAFAYCRSVSSLTLPEGLEEIGENAFYMDVSYAAQMWKYYGGKKTFTSLKNLKLPASLKTIGKAAFAGCDAVTAVSFGKNAQLESIGEMAFAGCMKLKQLALPDSVRTVGADAFTGCYSMTQADLGGGITELGDNAFSYCPDLVSFKAPGTLAVIGKDIFKEHGEKLTVTCPADSAIAAYLQENEPDVKIK